jgi:hypothetical protein
VREVDIVRKACDSQVPGCPLYWLLAYDLQWRTLAPFFLLWNEAGESVPSYPLLLICQLVQSVTSHVHSCWTLTTAAGPCQWNTLVSFRLQIKDPFHYATLKLLGSWKVNTADVTGFDGLQIFTVVTQSQGWQSDRNQHCNLHRRHGLEAVTGTPGTGRGRFLLMPPLKIRLPLLLGLIPAAGS